MHTTYEVMNGECPVATIDKSGRTKIYDPSSMPFDLELTASTNFNALVQNVHNFHHWCASRFLDPERQHATAILNSVALPHGITDKARAQNALTYHCLSMTDVYWVRELHSTTTFKDINPYENNQSCSCAQISLCGKQHAVEPIILARDLSTGGHYPKTWLYANDHFQLFKGGSDDAVSREVLASQICRCFDVDQVLYVETFYDGTRVSICDAITSLHHSIVSIARLETWLKQRNRDTCNYVLCLDRKNYYMMNIIDYLVGNTDRHWGNWGVLVDNSTNTPLRLHDLMDLNQSFNAYDTLDGANCLTTFGVKMTQKEAALQAVKAIGLNQICDVDSVVFERLPQYEAMFRVRLALLEAASK